MFKMLCNFWKIFFYILCLMFDIQGFQSFLQNKETEVLCSENETRCLDGSKCIPNTWFCDLAYDCLDYSDEFTACNLTLLPTATTCSQEAFKCKKSERCIPKSWVCDSQQNCGLHDDSDENNENCKSESICPLNHVLCDDGVTCRKTLQLCDDKNSVSRCDVEETCDQICQSRSSDVYKCQCVENGYELVNNRFCRAVNVPKSASMRLLYAERNAVDQVYANGSIVNGDSFTMIQHLTAFDFDHRNKSVCWISSVEKEQVLTCVNVNNFSNSWTYKKHRFYGLEYANFMARDWIAKNWYILDSRGIIFVCNDNMLECLIIDHIHIENKPRCLALNPLSGNMYYTAWGKNPPFLEAAEMDGKNRKIVANEKMIQPMGITVDFANNQIYWVDSYLGTIERINEDGSNRKTILMMADNIKPYGITVFENFLYVTSWKNKTIQRVHRFGPRSSYSRIREKIDDFSVTGNEPFFVHAFHRQRQPHANHPCAHNNGDCDHICIPLYNSGIGYAQCKCQSGFTIDLKTNLCVGNNQESFLIYGKGRPGASIKGVALDEPNSEDVILPTTWLNKPMRIDFDAKNKFIYFADYKRHNIERRTTNGAHREVVVSAIYNVDGLAFDWMGQNLYWSDASVGVIFTSPVKKPDLRRITVHGNLTKVGAVAVHPKAGLLFWTISEFVSPKFGQVAGLIETAYMDGTHREILVEWNLYWPTGLTIDYEFDFVYWTEEYHATIERIKTDGSGREIILKGPFLVQPYGISYMDQFIYWSDYANFTLNRVSLDDRANVQILKKEESRIFDVKVFSSARQKGENECSFKNCAQFCLATPKGAKCECSMGFEINDERGTICTTIQNYTTPIECGSDEFLCEKSLKCLKRMHLCDGVSDCHDSSDENFKPGGVCEGLNCAANMFKCGDKTCISDAWLCDGDKDCSDGSDELQINCKCDSDQFRCDSGHCISKSWVCDSQFDCEDRSDEHNCEKKICGAGEYKCPDESCIPLYYVCDMEKDCKSGADETHCAKFCSKYGQKFEFRPKNGSEEHYERESDVFGILKGLSPEWRKMLDNLNDRLEQRYKDIKKERHKISAYCMTDCDARKSDECKKSPMCSLCPHEMDENKCISTIQLCDLHRDCPSGFDERNCSIAVQAEMNCDGFLCASLDPLPQCIPKVLRCDGKADCFNKSDEINCGSITCPDNSFKCSESELCLHSSLKCDGQLDCPDGFDEKNCDIKTKCFSPSIECDNSTKCITPENICDGVNHCLDMKDEEGRCEFDDCDLKKCEDTCKQGPSGPYCVCPEGKKLLKDGLSCSTAISCKFGTCSQICTSFKTSYKCDCVDGYQLEPDGFTCKSVESTKPHLIYSTRHSILSLNLYLFDPHVRTLQFVRFLQRPKTIISSLNNVVALDVFYLDEIAYVFWTDVTEEKIYRGELVYEKIINEKPIIETLLANAEGFAVDWVGQNIYWVESSLNHIEVAKIDGTCRKTLISGNMDSPRAIAVDPREGILFWTDWKSNARIESASMAGENRRIILNLNNSDHGWPNGLTLDYPTKRIYWLDARSDSIHCAFYNGSDSREILRSHSRLSHPFSIAVFGNYVYWTDWRSNSVARANKFTGEKLEILSTTNTQPFDLKILHPSRQPKVSYNPCLKSSCSHLCLLSFNNTSKCFCPNIMDLDTDGFTCIPKEVFLIIGIKDSSGKFKVVFDSNKSTNVSEIFVHVPRNQFLASTIDFYDSDNTIYFFRKNDLLDRVNISGTNSNFERLTILDCKDDKSLNFRHFSIDYVSGNLFITSFQDNKTFINIATVNGDLLRPIIIFENSAEIESITLDPYNGKIFWSVSRSENSTIEMASMDGSNRRVLHVIKPEETSAGRDKTSFGLEEEMPFYYTALEYDYLTNRLYWITGVSDNFIQYYDIDAKQVYTVMRKSNDILPSALMIHEKHLYFYDYAQKGIFRVDKSTGLDLELVKNESSDVFYLKMVDRKLKLRSNACTTSRDICAHICIPVSKSEKKCLCSTGYKIDPTNSNICIGEDDVFIYSSENFLKGISVGNMTEKFKRNLVDKTNIFPFIKELSNLTHYQVDFHYQRDLLIFYDVGKRTMNQIQRDGTNLKVIFGDLNLVIGLTVDWLSNIVYFISYQNEENKVIELFHLDRPERYVLISKDLTLPTKISVHPEMGLLFWMEDSLEPRIVASNLNGEQRRNVLTFAAKQRIDYAIDYEENFLYFAIKSDFIIERTDFYGRNRETIISLPYKPLNVVIFKEFLFVALHPDDSTYAVNAIHKTYRTSVELISRPSNIEDYSSLSKSFILFSSNLQAGTNPCLFNNGDCEGLCLYDGEKVNCKCIHGILNLDGKTCKEYDAFLLYSNVSSVNSLHLFDIKNYNLPLKPIKVDGMTFVKAINFDYDDRKIYYVDSLKHTVNSVKFDGSEHKILAKGQKYLNDIAYDAKIGDLYWTSQDDVSINRLSVKRVRSFGEWLRNVSSKSKPIDLENWLRKKKNVHKNGKLLLDSDRNFHRIVKIVKLSKGDLPRALAIDSCENQIFWTNWNIKSPSIQRAFLNGQNITSIITTKIMFPTGITIDHRAKKLYWTDSGLGKIERSNMDGSNRVLLFEEISTYHPYAITVYADHIFWIDMGLNVIMRMNKYTGEDLQNITGKMNNIYGIVAVADDTNKCDIHACYYNKGGCEDVCNLDEKGTVECSCFADRILLKDEKGCIGTATEIPTENESFCGRDQFECDDGTCLPYYFSCDGTAECGDASDEKQQYCESRQCRDGYFRCDESKCILNSKVCDGFTDCDDFLDEINCKCAENQFRCETSGVCIDKNFRCNFEPDCHDASDEMNCGITNCSMILFDQYGKNDMIRCEKTTNCIHPKWICDGHNDCWDNSDEVNCSATKVLPGCNISRQECSPDGVCSYICSDDRNNVDVNVVDRNKSACPKDKISCASEHEHRCIYAHWRCDGVEDCPDGSDEPGDCKNQTCTETEFKCTDSGRCIPLTWVCDGDVDCKKNAEDEHPSQGCPLKTSLSKDIESNHHQSKYIESACDEGQFMCRLFRHREFECIPLEFYCDGMRDCMDGSDEPQSCADYVRACTNSQFMCKTTHRCIPKVWICNGRSDCEDSSDELHCDLEKKKECGSTHFRCDNAVCVQLDQLCDGTDDCGDRSDEDACGINECLETNTRLCEYKCVDMPIGYECQCKPGYQVVPGRQNLENVRISNDRDSDSVASTDNEVFRSNSRGSLSKCEDINECNTTFPCSQLCENTIGSFKCSCVSGYVLDNNGRSCTAKSDVDPHLILSIRFFIREIGLNDELNSFNKLIISNLTNVVALDYEWKSRCFYWTDVTHLSSSINKLCDGGKPEIIHTAVESPDGIAVDWVGQNLYWCDKSKETIEVSKLNGKFRKVLIDENLEDPRAIALDPFHGFMYWTDWGNMPHIGKAGMDGSNPQILINSTVGWPNALTISYATNELFWADAHYHYIGRCDLDGSNRRIIISKETAANYVQHIFAITVFEDWLYWTDWELKSVVKANKYTGANITKLYTAAYRPMDIHVFHPWRQLSIENNACAVDNGGCATMCLIAPHNAKTCACPHNYVLEENEKTCRHNCSNSQFECKSTYKCIPSFWKCDTQDDCGDMSDEPEDCRSFNCTPGQFQCDNFNCIHPSQICDSEDQCGDGSDETDCDEYTCMATQFKCPAYNQCSNASDTKCVKLNNSNSATTNLNNSNSATTNLNATNFSWNVSNLSAAKTSIVGKSDTNNSNFSRTSAFCIQKKRHCDGKVDCPGGEDELDCESRTCEPDWFKCKNGKCIPPVWVCDGDKDCLDDSDENADCPSRECKNNEFRCKNGRCIPQSWKCDGEPDCIEKEDEDQCTESRLCNAQHFKCDNNKCIPLSWQCDGDDDCNDNSDEKNCDSRTCEPGDFSCDNGRCIKTDLKCNGIEECVDGSDEIECDLSPCLSDEFQCTTTGACIDKAWLCDGDADCSDGSDEAANCTKECDVTHRRCLSGECKPKNWFCDGDFDCRDNSDEDKAFCASHECLPDYFRCENSICIQKNKHCDWNDDCGDGSDEGPICYQRCKPRNFECQRGHCISEDLVCDGFDDCLGGEDEKSCRVCLFGKCSQICNAKKNGTHTCSCANGYFKVDLFATKMVNERKSTCIASGDMAYLLVANENHLRKISPNRGKNLGDIFTSLDFHNKATKIRNIDILFGENLRLFWTNHHGRSIVSYDVPDTKDDEVFTFYTQKEVKTLVKGLNNPSGIAVDWVTKNVYFTDEFDRTISVVSFDGKKRTTLLGSKLNKPTDVVLDPASGQMFYNDIGYEFMGVNPRIGVCRMDGSLCRNLVDSNLLYPASLAIDHPAERLYWVDKIKGTIETIKFDGSDRHIVKDMGDHESIVDRIEIFEDDIYLLTANNSHPALVYFDYPPSTTVYRIKKFIGGSEMIQLVKYPLKIIDLVVVHEAKQDTTIFNPCASNPCDESAICLLDGKKSHSCRCPDGTVSKRESQVVLKCVPKYKKCPLKCHSGRCVVKDEGPTCECPPSNSTVVYMGRFCNIYNCAGYCKNSGNCTITIVEKKKGQKEPTMKCKCPPKWLGDRCNIYDESCQGRTCENGGQCNTQSSSKNNAGADSVCLCKEPFIGDYCEHCRDLRCKNGGICRTKGQDASYCSCPPSYYGIACEKSRCQSGCYHGTCVQRNGNWACLCRDGWSGDQCTQCTDENMCANSCFDDSCFNFGHCDSKACICPLGYYGHQCEYSYCDGICHNGRCRTEKGLRKCECNNGYEGLNCSYFNCQDCKNCSEIDASCQFGSCMRNLATNATFCLCEKGFFGEKCEFSVCDNFCANSGKCFISKSGAPFCHCENGYLGTHCEKDSCEDFCHFGICEKTNMIPVCKCEPGYKGKHCNESAPINTLCLQSPCKNGGTCHTDGTQRKCDCAEGFEGTYCEKKSADPCQPNPCFNGGICNVHHGIPYCRCTLKFYGTYCNQSEDCENYNCHNGATCVPPSTSKALPTCLCSEGFSGLLCEDFDFNVTQNGQNSSSAATVVIAVLVSIISVIGLLIAVLFWRRKFSKSGMGHVRLRDNGGAVELTNPMYNADNDEDDAVFTLQDSGSNFKNPVYDIMFDNDGPRPQEEKAVLLQSDPLGVGVLDSGASGSLSGNSVAKS